MQTTQTDADPEIAPPGIVPEWLLNLASLGWRVLAIGALLVILWLLASLLWTVTASVAIAIVIAAFFAPYAVRLRDRGMSGTAAAAVVWALALVVVIGAVLLLAYALLPYLAEVLRALDTAISRVEAAIADLNLSPAVADAAHAAVKELRGGSEGAASGLAASAAQAGTIAILAAFLVFFFLKDGDKAWIWIFQAAGDQKRERITEAGDDALWRVGGYLRGTTILSAIVAATDYVFMWLLGVPLALPLAILAFFSGYIPYFGGIVANLIILGVAFAALGAGPTIVLVGLIAVRTAILSYGVRPLVYGRTVNIHPAVVLIALPAGFEVAGVVGLFASVPVTAILLAVAAATVAILDPGPQPGLPALVPGWLDRLAQWAWRILVAIGLVALVVVVLVSMPLVTIPILLATILASTLEPGVEALIRRGRTRGQAAAILAGGGFVAVLLVVGLTLFVLVDQAAELGAGATAGASAANATIGGHLSLLEQGIEQGGGGLVQSIVAAGQAAASLAVIVVLSVLLAFYFLRDGSRLWAKLIGHVHGDSAADVESAAQRAVDVLGGYMIGTGAISFVGAASQLVIMILLGIPLALPVFVLSFVLCFVPYIGGFISTGLALLLTIAFGTPQAIAVMVVWTLVFNLVTGNVVGPLVYGKTVHLHPAVVMVAIPAGATIAGILGMFVVVPAMGVVAATWRTVLGVIGQQRLATEQVVSTMPEVPPQDRTAVVPGPEPGPN